MGKKIKRENVMIYRWVNENFPNALRWFRVRVGAIPDGPHPDLYAACRRWADAVIFDKDTVYIVEAKVRPDAGAVSQLELYMMLFKETPEFQYLWNKKVKGIYLCGKDDENIKRLCQKRNIKFVVYCPDWLNDYLCGGEGNPWKKPENHQ